MRDVYACIIHQSLHSTSTPQKKGEIKDIGRMKKRKQENSDSPAEDMASCVTR